MKHSLSSWLLTTPVPITAVDGQPLSSGHMTWEVFSTLHITDHTEQIHLGIVASPYPIILGLNWL